jgi:hypothetical protein
MDPTPSLREGAWFLLAGFHPNAASNSANKNDRFTSVGDIQSLTTNVRSRGPASRDNPQPTSAIRARSSEAARLHPASSSQERLGAERQRLLCRQSWNCTLNQSQESGVASSRNHATVRSETPADALLRLPMTKFLIQPRLPSTAVSNFIRAASRGRRIGRRSSRRGR